MSGARLLAKTQGERKKPSRESGMLFCAFCCSHSVLQSGGSLASIITTISLSPPLSHTNSRSLAPCLSHLLFVSYALLVCTSSLLSLPPLLLKLVTIRILITRMCCSSSPVKLTTDVNLESCLVVFHALYMNVYSIHK